jgi:hypothetical protein
MAHRPLAQAHVLNLLLSEQWRFGQLFSLVSPVYPKLEQFCEAIGSN